MCKKTVISGLKPFNRQIYLQLNMTEFYQNEVINLKKIAYGLKKDFISKM